MLIEQRVKSVVAPCARWWDWGGVYICYTLGCRLPAPYIALGNTLYISHLYPSCAVPGYLVSFTYILTHTLNPSYHFTTPFSKVISFQRIDGRPSLCLINYMGYNIWILTKSLLLYNSYSHVRYILFHPRSCGILLMLHLQVIQKRRNTGVLNISLIKTKISTVTL